MQFLAKAAGGEVLIHTIKEIGWRDHEGNFFDISLTKEGINDPLFRNVNLPLNIFHLHSETINLTKDIKVLATEKFCKNQVTKVGSSAYC